VLEPRQPEVRRLLVVMGPAVLGASVYQLNLLVVRVLSSFLGDGAVSYLYYADRLMELPLGVFIFALSTATLPTLSRLVKQGDVAGTRDAFSGTLALALALALPSTVGLIVLREPIFAVLFSWNPSVFGEAAVQGCAQALLFYALGLVPITLSRICVQLCLSHENTRTPARGAMVSLAVNVLTALALIGPQPPGSMPDWVIAVQSRLVIADLGFAGLALATSVAATANALYLAGACRRLYGAFQPGSDLLRALQLLLATGVMIAVLWLLGNQLPIPGEASLLGLLLLGLHVVAGVAGFFAGLALVRSPELGSLLAVVGWNR
jgi:putative peptidoglycan lipid II flippase